ncbi:MAG TPA: hypothetical protein VFI20_03630 [Terracidiphilus sp.]|nr:hypothetical protein [Terracidiphilus sp.]
MDPAAVLDHEFLIAAYAVTWTIQLGYLAWLAYRWRSERRIAARRGQRAR